MSTTRSANSTHHYLGPAVAAGAARVHLAEEIGHCDSLEAGLQDLRKSLVGRKIAAPGDAVLVFSRAGAVPAFALGAPRAAAPELTLRAVWAAVEMGTTAWALGDATAARIAFRDTVRCLGANIESGFASVALVAWD